MMNGWLVPNTYYPIIIPIVVPTSHTSAMKYQHPQCNSRVFPTKKRCFLATSGPVLRWLSFAQVKEPVTLQNLPEPLAGLRALGITALAMSKCHSSSKFSVCFFLNNARTVLELEHHHVSKTVTHFSVNG